MKEQDLRIGNLIKYRGEKDCIVNSLGSNGFETVNTYNGLPNGSSDLFEYNPIPLTEEWLLRFGFEKNEWYGMLVSSGKDISGCDYYKDSTSIRVTLADDVCQKGVHWFQNWYYFETDQELTLSPN